MMASCVAVLLLGFTITRADTVYQTIQVGSRTRGYYLHLPPSYTGDTAVPLVLMLHPLGSHGLAFERQTGFSGKADQEGFIVVYPNARVIPDGWITDWDAPIGDPQPDIDFLTVLMDHLENTYQIDPARIYVGGHSAGAMMTHLIGAIHSDRIAAIGPVSGAVGAYKNGQFVQAPAPEVPVSAVIFHGKRDLIVPYNGGFGFESPLILWASVAYGTQFWVTANGCNPTPTTSMRRGGSVVLDVYHGGADHTAVHLHTVVNGDHFIWNPNTPWITDAMWDFFRHHPKR
jgi:polyhydroxybutyrate depolymerase